MHEIELLLRQLDSENNIQTIRAQIVRMIFKNLACRRDSLDDWEKTHFANAIGSLKLNVDSPRPAGKGWLRLCLSDLEKALKPKEKRNSNAVVRSIAAEETSCAQLLHALETITKKIAADT